MTPTVGDDLEQGQQPRTPSPPTARVVAIVELLTRSAPDTLLLAQIVRLTGLSRATAHAVLAELVDRGWARRSPTGAFGLGPAFVSLARTTSRTDPLTHFARDALDGLAHDLQMPCFLARRLRADTIAVTDHAGADPDPWFRVGRQMRLRPPVCREFVAWEPAARRIAWVDTAPAATRTRLGMVLDTVAARGYSIERMTDDHLAMIDALGSLDSVSESLRTRVGDLLSELSTIDYLDAELTGDIGVVTVGAPVFDAAGTVVASVVSCPNRSLPAAQLRTLGTTTRTAADAISAALAA